MRTKKEKNVVLEKVLSFIETLPGPPDINKDYVQKFLNRTDKGYTSWKREQFPIDNSVDYKSKKGFGYVRNLYFGLQVPPQVFGYEKQDFETDWSPKATIEFLNLFNDPDIEFDSGKPENHYAPKYVELHRKYIECAQTSIFSFDNLYRVPKHVFQNIAYLAYHEEARGQIFHAIEKRLKDNPSLNYSRALLLENVNPNRDQFEQFTQTASLELLEHIGFCKREFGSRVQFYFVKTGPSFSFFNIDSRYIGFESSASHSKITKENESPTKFVLPEGISIEIWREDKHGDKYNLITHQKDKYPIAFCKVLGSLISISHFHSQDKLNYLAKQFEDLGIIEGKKIVAMRKLTELL